MHNYSEAKKLAMAALEFDGYALIWWEQVQNQREEYGEPPIATWAAMKQEMRARFVPLHYKRDLFDKLQALKQGTSTVEEYYKEMEKAMIRARVHENEEQTMARLMYGLNKDIKCIVNFQPYNTMVELVHQAEKAEKQLQEDAKFTRPATSKARFSLGQGTSSSSTSFNTNASSSTMSKTAPTTRPTVSTTSSMGSTTKSSEIQCFKCKGRGHMQKNCPNNQVMIVIEEGEYESFSEEEEPIVHSESFRRSR